MTGAAWRSLGMPMLLSPWFALNSGVGSYDFVFRASHLTAIALWVALLLISHRLFELFLERSVALVATLLMTFSPLLVHYAPTTKEDIAATFFLVASFYAYLMASHRQSRLCYLIAGVFAGMTITTRQNLLPLIFGFFLAAEIGYAFDKPGTWGEYLWRTAALLLLPSFIFFLAPMIAYPRVGLSSAMTSPGVLLDDIRDHLAQVGRWRDEGVFKNFRFIAKASTLPVVALSIVGMIAGLLEKRRGAMFCFLWIFFFFGVQTLAFKHREARFLFPALPPIYFFAGVALDFLRKWTVSNLPNRRIVILVTIDLVVFTAPLVGVFKECRRLRDPIYFDDVEKRFSQTAASLAGRNSIIWIGPYFPLHPRDYLFDREDDSTSIYHFGANAITWFTRRQVREIRVGGFRADDLATLRHSLNGAIDTAHEGDVFIINREAEAYDSRTLPVHLKPLLICRIRDGALHREAEFAPPE